MTEICKKCAECCKNHPFVDLSNSEIQSLEKATGLHPDVFTNQKGTEVEEYFLQFKENGHCFFLDEKDGSFSCSAYEARPDICKNYPAEPIQKDTCKANMEKFLNNIIG